MATAYINYISQHKVDCGDTCPADVVICIPPSYVAPIPCEGGGDQTSPWNHIDAQMINQCYTDVGCGTAAWKITLSYDDDLITEGKTLHASLISGIICKDCLYKLFTDLAGVPWTFTVNQEENTITFTDQYGCVTTVDIPQYQIFVEDTESIDMEITAIPTQTISSNLIVSGNAGNTLEVLPSGTYAHPLAVTDSESVDLTITGSPGQTLEAEVIVSPDGGNLIEERPNGLFVGPGGLAVADTDSVDLTLTGGLLEADVNLSADVGNTLTIETDGLYAHPLAVTDTLTVDLTISGTPNQTLSADVEVSADIDNMITVEADGLKVEELAVTDTNTVDLTITGATSQSLSADVLISADVGNIITAEADGLFVPASGGLVIGTINSETKSANGAVIDVQDLVMQTADATFPGLVSTGAQSFSGQKTFLSAPILDSLTATRPLKIDGSKIVTASQINLASTNDVTGILPIANGGTGPLGTANQLFGVNAGATANEYKTLSVGTTGTDFNIGNAANSVVLNLPDASATNRGVITTGTQTLAGAKTFSSLATFGASIAMSAASNLIRGTTSGGSDNSAITITPADAVGITRAAQIIAAGNENALTGSIYLTAGAIAGGNIFLTLSTTSTAINFVNSTGIGILAALERGKVITRAGLASATFAALGGTLAVFDTDASSTGTGETDLYSYTLPANTLGTDLDYMEFWFEGTYGNEATHLRTVRLYFGGTLLTTALTETVSIGGLPWAFRGRITRVNNTTQRMFIYRQSGTSGNVLMAYAEINATLSNSNILKVTGQMANAGAGPVTARVGGVKWFSGTN